MMPVADHHHTGPEVDIGLDEVDPWRLRQGLDAGPEPPAADDEHARTPLARELGYGAFEAPVPLDRADRQRPPRRRQELRDQAEQRSPRAATLHCGAGVVEHVLGSEHAQFAAQEHGDRADDRIGVAPVRRAQHRVVTQAQRLLCRRATEVLERNRRHHPSLASHRLTPRAREAPDPPAVHASVASMQRHRDTEVWQSLGTQDPDWAVATTPGRKHGGWSDDLDLFYATGRARVADALELVPQVGRDQALDWGAGTGRLSFALAERFGRVTCVDISTSMQDLLAQRAEQRGVSNLDLVTVDAFRPRGEHDFALSLITMQHFSDRAAVEQAIRAMVASLRPGGALVFEIPLRTHRLRHRLQPRLRVYRLLRRVGVPPQRLHDWGFSGMSMLCVPRRWVEEVVRSAGASVLEVREHRGTTHQQAWYAARRLEP